MNIVYEYSESVADGVAYYYGLNRTHNSEGEIYVYNAHGDVVQLVKENAVVVSYTYDAFGNLTAQIGESDNPFLYCGEYYDAESQAYYLRARYYDPTNGRFTQQDAWAFMDASDPLSLNLYTYCCNNPVMYVDPSGHLAASQYLSFLWEVVVAGAETTWDNMGGGIFGIASRVVGTASTLYQTMSDLLSGDIAFDDLIKAIGQDVWDGLSGDIRYIIENYKMFDPSVELSTEEVKTLAQHTAGAYEEIVQVAFIIDGAVKTIKQATAATKATNTTTGVCFVAGTLVLTDEGLKSIETIRAGGFVVSADVHSRNRTQLQRVVQIFENSTYELVHVYVSGEDIVTTPSHPFWVLQKGWTEASQLRVGDILVLASGDYAAIEKVQHEILEEPITVYNFEVENYHTYYVGNSSILVHNACQASVPQNGATLNSSDALSKAVSYLGEGYYEASPGGFVSADGLRQDRLTNSDLAVVGNHAGAPHLNFETLAPNPSKPGKYMITSNSHVFIVD